MSDDLITALVVRRGTLSWTTLRRKKNRLEVAEEKTVTFDWPAGVTDLHAPEVVERIKPICAQIKGRVALALPTEQVLMRVARFPTLDAGEIRDMAALQVDKFSPFPVDQMTVSQEILAQSEGASRVVIATVTTESVNRLGGALQAAGLFPRAVDVEVLGWWRLLKQKNQIPETGRHLILLLEETGAELLVVQDGVPVLLRSLGAVSALAPAEAAAELAEELNYTLTTLETEWGSSAAQIIQVWHRQEVPVEFMVRLREDCQLEVETKSLTTLPSLTEGLARRSAERGPHLVDLAPTEWKTSLESRKLRRGLLVATAILFGVWLVGVLVLAGGLLLENRRLTDIKAEVEQLKKPAAEVEQMKQQVRSLERYATRTHSGLECLREVSALLPEGVDLTAFTYKKYAEINLRGESDASAPIYDFFQALEKSGLFTEVKPEGVTQQARGGRNRSQFRVTLVLPGEST
jgi:Tfp pilus assembly protein PilN